MPTVLADVIKCCAKASEINEEVIRVADTCVSGPCFIMANYMEAHHPYLPEPPYKGMFSSEKADRSLVDAPVVADTPATTASFEARYDEAIRMLDAELGKLVRELERRGFLDNTWLFITSDHGEAFGEHGVMNHATGIHNEQVRIPLIIQPPKGIELPQRTDAVDLLDLTATISAIGGASPLGIGQDLREPEAEEVPIRIQHFAFDGKNWERFGALATVSARAVIIGHVKLIEQAGERELYYLDEDPDEQLNRAQREPSLVREMSEVLPPSDAGEAEPAVKPRTLPVRQEDALRALGYVE